MFCYYSFESKKLECQKKYKEKIIRIKKPKKKKNKMFIIMKKMSMKK